MMFRPSFVVVGVALFWLGTFAVSGRLHFAAPTAALGARALAVHARSEVGKRSLVTVNGRVLDTFGGKLAGASVRSAHGEQATADASGSFQLALSVPTRADAGVVDLEFSAPGMRTRWQRLALHAPDAAVVRLAPAAPWDQKPYTPEPALAVLFGEGFVRTHDGKPGAHTFVTVGGSGVWARTDAIGRFRLPLPAGELELIAHQPGNGDTQGLAVKLQHVRVDRDKGVVPLPDLITEPAARLSGRVLDQSGTPVVGVPVEVRGDGFSRIVDAGMSGGFSVAGLLPGHYEVRAIAFCGYIGTPTSAMVTESGGGCDVTVAAVGERRMRILDEAGQPVARAHVVASCAGERCAMAQADTEGWALVRAARDGMEWEVRLPECLQALPVQRREPEALVVAMP